MTIFKKSQLFPALLILLFTMPMMSCIKIKINIRICEYLPPIAPGQSIYYEIRESVGVKIPPSKFTWSGKLDELVGPPPNQFLLVIEHRAKGGKILDSWSLTVPVNPDGKIPKMSAAFPGAILKPMERVRVHLIPVGGPFLGALLNIRFISKEDVIR